MQGNDGTKYLETAGSRSGIEKKHLRVLFLYVSLSL